MSKQSREDILGQRVSQLITECDKTFAHIEYTKATANESLNLLKNIKDEYFSTYFKKILPKLDEIMFNLIDFNDSFEKEEKKISNIFDEFESHSNNYLKLPEKFEDEDIADNTPANSIEDEYITVDGESDDINTDDKTNENEIYVPDEPFSVKVLADYHIYSKDDNFDCIVVHVENPWCIYVVPREYSNEYQCLLSELNQLFNDSVIGFTSKEELINSNQSCFMIFDNIINTWCRAIVNNTLPDQIDQIEVFSIDTGRKFVTDISKVYLINHQLISWNNYLFKVKLNLVQPLTHSEGQWSKECIEYLRKYELKHCSVIIEKVSEDYLLVHMSYEKNDLSMDITLKHFAQFDSGDDEDDVIKVSKTPTLDVNDVIENIQSESNDTLFDENFGPDINIEFDNLKLNDEKILCQFYKGPPDTTCFKGDRCKKIHKLFNKDGLTLERVPIQSVKMIDLPNPDTEVKVLVTSIKSCRNIYVQLLSVEKGHKNDIDYEQIQEKFKNNISDMNKKKNILSMKDLDYSPALGELVAAQYDKNMSWQRARVISISSDSVELIFIDYGEYSEVKIKDVKKLKPEYFEFPVQAVECIIINVKKEQQDKIELARSQLSDMILNKTLTAIVKYTQVATGLMEIILLDENGFDVAGMLSAYDLIEFYNDSQIVSDNAKYIDEGDCKIRLIPG